MDNNTYEDIYSSSSRGKNKRYKASSKKRKAVTIILIILGVILVAYAGMYLYVNSTLNKVERIDLGEDLGIAQDERFSKDVINIAFYGLDTRYEDDRGRTDSIMIATIDKVHNKIKLTSIARDTYVSIDGRGKDKINHAWAFGKAPLAVKTLNQNFDLDITDFICLNFYQFANIIDYLGGVTLDVSDAEVEFINNNMHETNNMGIIGQPLTHSGVQVLSGAQALAYSRDRYTSNGDVGRGNHQRKVVEAAITQAGGMSKTKYPELINTVLSNCTTSLDNNEMLNISTWAVVNSPLIEDYNLPNENCNAQGQMINGIWYYVYDLNNATRLLKDFIYEN